MVLPMLVGPCWDHVWPKILLRTARDVKYLVMSRYGLLHIYDVNIFWDHVEAMFVP